ncbi:hypothetical protein [Allohahella marinimesophila]|uniref:DNA-binding protein n=1 Tax=Allohahella marinimesophila TaxID=1054972 RepID=A0ABP7PVZ4_9GAMM
MPDVVFFKPRSENEAKENLAAFIQLCRKELTVFGADLNWGAATWPKVQTFAKLGVSTRRPQPDQVMDEDFIQFAKAYFRYQQGHKPTGTKNEGKALRALESALLQVNGSAHISGISIVVLDEAAKLGAEYYSKGAAYHFGRELERLTSFVSSNKLIPHSVSNWSSPIRRHEDTIRTGMKAKKDREKKLPNQTALNALAEIFANNPENHRDIFTTSVFALLMSAPSRITEVLALPVDCEHFETDRKGVERYGLRFFSGKGFDGDIKWVPTEMVGIAKQAVARAKALSENARKLATYVEANSTRFYRHSDCPQVADDTPLTIEQSAQALGMNYQTRKDARTSLFGRKLSTRDGVHTLNSLWQHTLERLPEGFPYLDKPAGIKFSNALFALNKTQLHAVKATLPVELIKPTNNFFNNDLGPREALGKDAHQSIFDRHGYRDTDGACLRMTSHQARHLLNTIAQRGGLSNLAIAKWSGRADVNQNRTYNHMTEFEVLARAEQLDPSKELFGPTGEVAKNLPVTTQEFNAMEQGPIHVTEYGFCVHDYTMSPCEKYRDCINCTEQVCIKGDDQKLERVKKRLDKTERLFAAAQQAMEDGDMGADRWYQYQEKTVIRLRELVSILDNPDVEDGSQVKLRGNDFSQLRRVAEKKSVESKSVEDGGQPSGAFLTQMAHLLGGGLG